MKKPFQAKQFLAVSLSVLILVLSAFQILVARSSDDVSRFDCIQLLLVGGIVWSFQKRDWTESGMDFAYKIFIIFVGVALCVWIMLDGSVDVQYAIQGVSLAMFGARLLCLPVSKKEQQKPESDGN